MLNFLTKSCVLWEPSEEDDDEEVDVDDDDGSDVESEVESCLEGSLPT